MNEWGAAGRRCPACLLDCLRPMLTWWVAVAGSRSWTSELFHVKHASDGRMWAYARCDGWWRGLLRRGCASALAWTYLSMFPEAFL